MAEPTQTPLGFPDASNSGNNTITGNSTFSGTTTFTGPVLAQNINAQVWASQYTGATCGDKIVAALQAVPSSPGGITVHINNACGMGTATTPWAAVNVPNVANVILSFDEPGIYWIRTISFPQGDSGITSPFTGSLTIGNQQNCPVTLKVGNGVNPAAAITLNGTQNFVQNVIIDGNKANNPTEGVGILVNAANRAYLGFGGTQNFASHGIWVKSTLSGDESCCGTITQWTSTLNNGNGLYVLNSADFNIGEASSIEINGITATVNTTATSITATSGSWSTDTSLVGTMLRVNNTGMCQVLAIPSTTTITVAAATCWNASGVPTSLGTQTGVGLNWGSGIEAQNSPTMRINHMEAGSNGKMDAILVYGTSTGIGSNSEQITSNAMGNGTQHYIEIIGSCVDVQTSLCSTGNIIVGNRFWTGNQGTVANTFDKIKLVDGGQNVIIGNYFNASTSTSQEKAAIEQVESAASRVAGGNRNDVALNRFNGTWGTTPYIDSTAQGSVGLQVPVFGGGNVNSTMDLFDVTTGAATPHKYVRVASGNLQLLNNAGSVIQQTDDGGDFRLTGLIRNVANTGILSLTLKKGSGAGNYTTASTTYVVVDSTNLCNTVTIPTGWKLGISASGALGTATGAVLASIALTDNAACGTANAGILVESTETSTGAGVLEPFSLNWAITGDGASHSIALQYKTSNAADSATILNASATQLPTVLFTLMPSN